MAQADSLLGEIVANHGGDACYLIISDHGARPVKHRMAEYDIEFLLEKAGLLASETPGDTTWVCRISPDWSPYYRLDLLVNPSLYRTAEGVNLDSYRNIVQKIKLTLESLKTEPSGVRLFEKVATRAYPEEEQADIEAYLGKIMLEMPKPNERLRLGDQEIELRSIAKPHPWSGRDRARGILIASGCCFNKGFVGAWMLDNAYLVLFRYMRGTIIRSDFLPRILAKLHLIDEATTLDITPTLLYLMNWPIGDDMDGRILFEMIDERYKVRKPQSIPTWGHGARISTLPTGKDHELRKRLRALGYMQ